MLHYFLTEGIINAYEDSVHVDHDRYLYDPYEESMYEYMRD